MDNFVGIFDFQVNLEKINVFAVEIQHFQKSVIFKIGIKPRDSILIKINFHLSMRCIRNCIKPLIKKVQNLPLFISSVAIINEVDVSTRV